MDFRRNRGQSTPSTRCAYTLILPSPSLVSNGKSPVGHYVSLRSMTAPGHDRRTPSHTKPSPSSRVSRPIHTTRSRENLPRSFPSGERGSGYFWNHLDGRFDEIQPLKADVGRLRAGALRIRTARKPVEAITHRELLRPPAHSSALTNVSVHQFGSD